MSTWGGFRELRTLIALLDKAEGGAIEVGEFSNTQWNRLMAGYGGARQGAGRPPGPDAVKIMTEMDRNREVAAALQTTEVDLTKARTQCWRLRCLAWETIPPDWTTEFRPLGSPREFAGDVCWTPRHFKG